MAEQLALISPAAPRSSRFRLDDHTRQIGMRGVAEARRILAEMQRAADERAADEGAADEGAADGRGAPASLQRPAA